MPLPRTPEYGDAARLDKLASGTKLTHGTYGPEIQRTPAGRPTGTTGTPAPRQGKQEFAVPPQKALFDELARAEWVRQSWRQIAASSPTPWVQGMLQVAERNFEEVASRVYNAVPNVEI